MKEMKCVYFGELKFFFVICFLSSKFGKQEKLNDFLNLINKKWNVCIYLFRELELFAFFFFFFAYKKAWENNNLFI